MAKRLGPESRPAFLFFRVTIECWHVVCDWMPDEGWLGMTQSLKTRGISRNKSVYARAQFETARLF